MKPLKVQLLHLAQTLSFSSLPLLRGVPPADGATGPGFLDAAQPSGHEPGQFHVLFVLPESGRQIHEMYRICFCFLLLLAFCCK